MEKEYTTQQFIDQLNSDDEVLKAFINWLSLSHSHIHPPLFRLRHGRGTVNSAEKISVFKAFNAFVRETKRNESPIRLSSVEE